MNRVRLALCVMVFCGLSVTGTAQEERATPVVTAAAPVEKIRFAGSLSAVQMRIEVRSAGGGLVYDSDWKDGNILDWSPQDSSGQPLAYGLYRLVMRSKNLAGQASDKEASLHVDSGGMAIAGQPSASPKMTLTAHDGEMGQLITTSGDLSFRFGDFLNRKDTEAMRLTAAGDLNVSGIVHTKGVMFPDGTILTTAAGLPGVLENGATVRQRASAASKSLPAIVVRPQAPIPLLPNATANHIPRSTATPDDQFKVDSAGVHIGTTAAFGLDVAGDVTLSSNLGLPSTTATGGVIKFGAIRFVHNYPGLNTFLGPQAGNLTMSGCCNTGIGNTALLGNTTGFANTASGHQALETNTIGTYNTAIGYNALLNNSSGNYNTASGINSLLNNTTGSSNIGVGKAAGSDLTTGDNNIDIGHTGFATEANTIRIGSTQTRTFIAGISGVTTPFSAAPVLIDANGQLATAMSSRRYKFDINSMGAATDDLMRLRPVTFRYLAHGDNAPLQYGLIAEEVAEVYPELVTRNKNGEVETVTYQFLAPMLLNEVQKQHRQIEEQRAENTTLGQRTADLEADNAALRNQLERLTQRVAQLEGKRTASH